MVDLLAPSDSIWRHGFRPVSRVAKASDRCDLSRFSGRHVANTIYSNCLVSNPFPDQTLRSNPGFRVQDQTLRRMFASHMCQKTYMEHESNRRNASKKGCGIKGFIPTSVIQGNPLFLWGVGLWEALFVVSQKWSFPTALTPSDGLSMNPGAPKGSLRLSLVRWLQR